MQDLAEQMARFWSLRDGAIRAALAGMLLLAVSCGSLGCFIVLRRLSLLGDSLGHAVLPGICLGFIVAGGKQTPYLFAGAALAALAAGWLIGVIERHTRLKPDVALGVTLSAFFGAGIVMLSRLQHLGGGRQTGLETFLYGQASAISESDLALLAGIAAVIVAGVALAFKELAAVSFDEGFAAAVGVPAPAVRTLLMGLTALAIVISIQAVGVVLLSALLITPAATALLLTDRLRPLVLLSILIAAAGGVLGLNLSYVAGNLPTGPFIVLVLAGLFTLAYLFSPRYGVVVRYLRQRARARRTLRENALKRLHQAWAAAAPATGALRLARLAEERGVSVAALSAELRPLSRTGWVDLAADEVRPTEEGLRRARELERNYRLWELFLTHEVRLPADHTQRDAEDLEHLLTPELVRELEERYGGNDECRSPNDE